MSEVASSLIALFERADVNPGLAGNGSGNALHQSDNKINEYLVRRYPKLVEEFGWPFEMVTDKRGVSRPVDFNEDFFAGVLGDEGRTVFCTDENRFYRYDAESGIFVPTTCEKLAASFSSLLHDVARECADSPGIEKLEFAFRKSNRVKGVIERAKGRLDVPSSYFDQEVGELQAVQNGVLRLADRVLLPFDAAYKLRRKLAVPFNADARCPQFLEVLLRQALTEDDIELLQRWFGLVILGQNRAQVILLLIGTAGGGKGTIVRILKLLLGPSNVVSLRIRQLEGRFELGRMLSRSLAYGADVPADFLNTPGANVLKAITGGDPIAVELKGSNARPEMQLSLNVLITANVRLRARLEGGEDTAAWRRRLRIIQFNNPPPTIPIHDLAERLVREEGPGILNWALDGLVKLRNDGFNLWPNARQQRIVDELLTESDSVYHFVQNCLRPGSALETLTVTDAYGEYIQYCAARGWNAVSRKEFGGKLPPLVTQCLGVAVRNDIVGMNGRQQHGFRGVVCHRPRHTEA